MISTLSLTPRRPGVTQNPNFSIYTLRTFSLETAAGRSEPKLESSSMETLNESNAAATTSADIEKSRASGDSSHDVITGSTDVEKSGDLAHDIITDVEKSGDSAHDIITDVEKSGDSSHEVEGTSCDSEVDPSLASDERYAYLQKGFTTEIYKIEICNLPPFLGYQVPATTSSPAHFPN